MCKLIALGKKFVLIIFLKFFDEVFVRWVGKDLGDLV